MKEKSNEKLIAVNENIKLGQDDEQTTKYSKFKKLRSVCRELCYRARMSFSKKCDASIVSKTFERLYQTILNCPIKIFGTFLLVLGASSIGLSFIIEEDFIKVVTSSTAQASIFIFIIGLMFLTSNKLIGELLSTSKILSQLSITYNQPVFIVDDKVKKKGVLESYSTAFFTGIICGIISTIYPASLLVFFGLAVVYSLFIVNRPECGLPLAILILPFVSPSTVTFLCIITFFSLIIKYLRGKRHIDFKGIELLIIISCVFIVLKAAVSDFTLSQMPRAADLFAFFFTLILTISLVRSTAMFRRVVSLLLSLSHTFAAMLLIYYLLNIIIGKHITSVYLSNLSLAGTVSAVTSKEFISAFIVLTVPINFAVVIGKKSKEKLKNLIYLIILLASSAYVCSYALVLTLLIGCVAVMMFNNIKNVIWLIPCPFLAYGAMWLYKLIPEKYQVTALTSVSGDYGNTLQNIKNNLFLGNGFIDANIDNTLLAILFTLGIFASLLVVLTIVLMFIKSFKSVFSINLKDKSRTYAYGLLSGAICFIIASMFNNAISDFRIMFLFAYVLSLSFTSGRCFMADFVDPTSVREQIYHE